MAPRGVMVVLSYLEVAVGALAVAYVGLLVFAWLFSDRMIFAAPPPGYADGPDILKIATPDGVMLAARHLPRPGARFTMVYFHGNAEDLGAIEERLQEFRDRLGVAVLAWDYRGYGRSGGRPDEASTLRDARTVAGWLTGHLGVPPNRIILYGFSLGGAPAVDVAADRRFAGLILQSAFTSAFRVMTRVRLLPFDKFDSLAKIGRVRCPVLVIHGTADRTVPFSHGRRLYDGVRAPKEKLWVEGAGHVDVEESSGAAYWETLARFLDRAGG